MLSTMCCAWEIQEICFLTRTISHLCGELIMAKNVLNNILSSQVDKIISGLEKSGFQSTKHRQPNGKWKIIAIGPIGDEDIFSDKEQG